MLEHLHDGGAEGYIDRLRNKDEWGDELTLKAISNTQNVNIFSISSEGRDYNRQFPENSNPHWPNLRIGHYHEVHYVSTTKNPEASMNPLVPHLVLPSLWLLSSPVSL